jgi:hypothetical protein
VGSQTENIPECLVHVRAGPRMHARRGGFTYLWKEMAFHNELRKSGFLNTFHFLRNIALRLVFRLTPNFIRGLLYNRFARKKKGFYRSIYQSST